MSVEEAASETLELVSALYAEAFLRTENWRSGSYEAVWALFEQEAARAARDELETLTAGSEASKRFASIEPLLADLQLEVLTLEGTEPTLVLATARFRAMAALVTGGAVEVTSSGHYFLRRGDAGWRVVAYGVEREDSPVTASTGPNSSTVEPS